MKKKKVNSIKHEEKYVEFLKKRLKSKNFKANVSSEEFEKTKAKYDKAKLKVNMMKQGFLKQLVSRSLKIEYIKLKINGKMAVSHSGNCRRL